MSPIVAVKRSGLALAVIVVAVLIPEAAGAHSFLVRTTPQPGARLTNPPDEIVLDFSEQLTGTFAVDLKTASGTPQTLPFVALDGSTRIRANLPALTNDAYQVTWRITAQDGHASEGEFVFAVGVELPAGATPTTGGPSRSTTQWPDALSALAILAGIATALGGLVSERIIWATTARPARDRADAAPVSAGLTVAITGLFSALALSLKRSGALTDIGRWADALVGRFDRLTLHALALTVIAAIFVRRERIRPYALAPIVAAIWLLVARGHPSDADQWWAVPTTALHVIIAGAWFGALMHLHRTARVTTDSHAIERGPRRYARLAAVLVVAAIGLGSVAALAQFERPAQLVTTRYGRVLAIKIVFLVGVLGIAAAARRRALPANGVRVRRLARYTRVELCGLVTVLAASAVLASTTPPTSAGGFILGPEPLPGPTGWVADLAGNHMVLAAATTDRLQVRAYPPGGQPDAKLAVSITGRNPDGSGFDLYPRACGYGCKEMTHPWPDGQSTITVTVGGGDYEGGSATLSVPWPPGPDGSELLARAVAATKAATTLRVTETVNSGPNATSGPYQLTTTGSTFISALPYANGADDIHQLAGNEELSVITFTVSGSNTWHQLWIDNNDRIRRQVFVDPGHRVEHRIDYDK